MFAPPSPTTPPAGLIIELVTPLTPAGSLDRAALGRLVEHLLPHADGLFGGSPVAGEGLALPHPVRLELCRTLLDLVQGRRPLWFGITGDSPAATLALAAAVGESARKYPGPLWLADLPLWCHSNRGLPRHLTQVADAAGLPLVVLNLPQEVQRRAHLFKHRHLRTQVVKKLAALPQVVGLVYQGDMRRFLNYHLAAVNRPAFAFYEADEARFLTRPGAWGVVSPGALLGPRAWQRVTRACLHPEEVAEDFEARRELLLESHQLLALAALYRSAPAALLKAALTARGMLAGDTLAPDTPFPDARARQKIMQLPGE